MKARGPCDLTTPGCSISTPTLWSVTYKPGGGVLACPWSVRYNVGVRGARLPPTELKANGTYLPRVPGDPLQGTGWPRSPYGLGDRFCVSGDQSHYELKPSRSHRSYLRRRVLSPRAQAGGPVCMIPWEALTSPPPFPLYLTDHPIHRDMYILCIWSVRYNVGVRGARLPPTENLIMRFLDTIAGPITAMAMGTMIGFLAVGAAGKAMDFMESKKCPGITRIQFQEIPGLKEWGSYGVCPRNGITSLPE